ncbi:MAG TPA: DUF6223 family protein [Flavisolibacter sp.]|nr:DUF6223 family protein [Flavisolibacter sp.]
MNQDIFRHLSAWILIGFIFLTAGTAFSQTIEKENNGATTKTIQAEATTGYVKGITAGRARALAGVALGLTSLIIAWRSKALSSKAANGGRTGASLALSLAVISILLSIIHLSNSVGAVFGSGSGKAGAIFAIVLSVVGMILAGFTLRQKRYKETEL